MTCQGVVLTCLSIKKSLTELHKWQFVKPMMMVAPYILSKRVHEWNGLQLALMRINE